MDSWVHFYRRDLIVQVLSSFVKQFLFVLAITVQLQAAPLRSDEQLVFFPSIGYRVGNGGATWELEIRGCLHETEPRQILLPIFRKALGFRIDDMSEAERVMFADRARAFLADNERGKEISILLGRQPFKIGKTKANGHFQGRVRLSAAEAARLQGNAVQPHTSIRFQAKLWNESNRNVFGDVHLLEPTGVSVISDIDDTIKISRINDRQELLRKTFVEPFAPVPGMAPMFQSWATNAGARFHYVSASPWQLYEPLSEFAASNGFPSGTFHLKNFRWKDEDFFSLFASPKSYKTSVIEPLLKRFPQRRFVLVGDSGEQDPEIYAALARRYPRQITRLLIRDTTGEGKERYATAFKDLPSSLWQLFQDPAAVRGLVP
jgi:hypothetical protein